MRNVALTLAALTLASTAAAAQAVPAGSWAEEKMFERRVSHDFGSVPRGAQLQHRFTMTNPYAVPLEVTISRISCGCVTATPSVKTLDPRGTGSIDVTMDARRFTGAKLVKVTVTVSSPQYNSTAELKVTANARADIVLNPGAVNFGAVARGTTPTQTIDVEYAGVLDWRASELNLNSAPITASFKEMYRRPGQVGYQVSLTLKADAPAGILKQEVFLKTNDPATPQVPIAMEAVVQAPLTVSPEVLAGISLKVGEGQTRRVVVRGNRPFRILSVDGLGEGVTVVNPLPSAAATVQIVTFKYQPTEAGEFKRQLQIKTDLQDEAVTVKVDGTVAAP